MQYEYKSLLEKHTLDLVPLLSRRNIFKCRWVYKKKSTGDRKVSRYKERLVSKGFKQVHGIY
jgi:hypothetical protein